VTLGKDWPSDELRPVLESYGFRILGRERRQSGPAPWRRLQRGQRLSYDADATWTETHYTIRREVTCEACGQAIGYSFEVDQISRVHKENRSTDGTLQRELGRQLRRRLRCPACGAVQREPRRTLLRQGHRQAAAGCGMIVAGLSLVGGLAALGGWLGDGVGLLLGLLAALVAVIVLWYAVLPYFLSLGPPI
jgi:hypothetical protein